MSSDLGKKVREIREAEGFGRQAFCDMIGVPKQTLINVEMGRSGPSGKLLAEVSQAFSKYTLWLMTNQTNEEAGQVSPDIEKARDRLKPTGTDTESRSK
ncbi:helix-turn-helix transcriptional regulator [Salinicola avicenniae]|uniref:helix-turn-helix transcriptional regulator n=1 Tax=Salinicola avicenniae TaxID=2916836 RepID=UPI0020735DA4|nr:MULTISPECIES: helix-turn-helix transcriptional regulator [unclassified Salinicola]